MVLQPFVGPWPLFQSLNIFTQPVGLLGRGISPLQGGNLGTGQNKHRINAHKHPCLKWDSNPRSQCLSGRRQFMPPWCARCRTIAHKNEPWAARWILLWIHRDLQCIEVKILWRQWSELSPPPRRSHDPYVLRHWDLKYARRKRKIKFSEFHGS
jgi:hypothetical protein